MVGMSTQALTAVCARLRPAADATDPLPVHQARLRSLAGHHQSLTIEIEEPNIHLKL